MFLHVTTMKDEPVAINVATVSYIGKSRSGTVIVLTDGSSFNVREDYGEVLLRVGDCSSAP